MYNYALSALPFSSCSSVTVCFISGTWWQVGGILPLEMSTVGALFIVVYTLARCFAACQPAKLSAVSGTLIECDSSAAMF